MNREPAIGEAPPLAGFLAGLRDVRVYFDALHGNHGDRLLQLAAEALLQNSGIRPVGSARSADLILINGGGSMAEGWFGLGRLAGYSRRFPDVPLAVLPSSFLFAQSGLRELCAGRRGALWLWARERPSYELLLRQQPGCPCRVGLDHDLAYGLRHHPLVGELRRAARPRHLLVVERDDWEGTTGRVRPFAPPGLDFIPEGVRSGARKLLFGRMRRRQDRESVFCRAALDFMQRHHPQTSGLPSLVADISLAETCDFKTFTQRIASAAAILTTRLHVAILGQLLDIRTYLVAGRYHKYRGVFDLSMQGSSVELLSWNGQDFHSESAVEAASSNHQPPA